MCRFFERNNITLDITPKSLATQVRWFNSYLESVGCRDYKTTPKQCGEVFDDSLFWVGAIGINDYSYIFGSSVTTQTIQQLSINRTTGFLQVWTYFFSFPSSLINVYIYSRTYMN